jgi:hypothetical protein
MPSSVRAYTLKNKHIFINKVANLMSLNFDGKYMEDILPPVLAMTA